MGKEERKKKPKKIAVSYVRPDTKIKFGRLSTSSCYIAFDFYPETERDLEGLAIEDPAVADALESHFKRMAAALRNDKKIEVISG